MLSVADPNTDRGRVCAAVLSFVGEAGYHRLTPEALERERGIGAEDIFRHFDDLDSCVEVIWSAIDEEVCALTGAAFSAAPDWRSGIRAALGAALGYLASEPAAARLYLVDSIFLGDRLGGKRYRSIGDLAAMIAKAPQPPPPQIVALSTISEALAGAAWRLAQRLVDEGRAAELPERVGELTYFCVLPFYGREEAEAELRERW